MEPRFSQSGRRALVWAYQSARRLGDSAIDCCHLLLGALQEEDGRLALQAEQMLRDRPASGAQLSGPTALTPGAANCIEQAAAMASPNGIITARWLLCALVRDPGSRESLLLQQCLPQGPALACRLRESSGKGPRKELKVTLQFGEDMTQKALRGGYDPVACREDEIGRMTEILCRRQKCNPILLGPAGVGKTALAEGLAARIAEGRVPPILQGKRLISLPLAGMVAGTKYRGEFEERVRTILQEVQSAGDVILFIDEIHTLCGAGSAEGAIDGGNLLKPALARGGLQVIGATTGAEFQKYISRDGALARRFRPVQVRETTGEQTLAVLQALCPRYETHHRLTVTDEALQTAVRLSPACQPGRADPDRTVDLLDEAAARASLEGRDLLDRKGVERTARLLSEGRDTGPDLERRLLALEDTLCRQVLGQSSAAGELCRALIRRAAFPVPGRPLGAFLLCGPSGVGKTAMAKALAQGLWPGQNALIRLDMSEYQEKHSVSRLIGSPPGYVGYGEGGQLTRPVKEQPASVVLLDEIEKAHPDVLDLLLQMLEEGCLTDGAGDRVFFGHAVVILTSNLGARESQKAPCGFVPGEEGTDRALTAVKSALRPELLGRLDGVIPFVPLSHGVLEMLALRRLEELEQACLARGMTLTWEGQVPHLLADVGRGGNARDLARRVRHLAEDPLARAILSGLPGQQICLRACDGKVTAAVDVSEMCAAGCPV